MERAAGQEVATTITSMELRQWLLIGLYGTALAAPPVLAVLSGQGGDGEGLVYQAGRCCALSAFMVLCLQIVLTGRFPVVERPFGLDVLVRFHRRMAVVHLGCQSRIGPFGDKPACEPVSEASVPGV